MTHTWNSFSACFLSGHLPQLELQHQPQRKFWFHDKDSSFLSVLHLSISPAALHLSAIISVRSHLQTFAFLCVSLLFSAQTLEGCEILVGPEVTYGPSDLDLLCPVAMTMAHCAEVDAENWNIQLKRKTQDGKWEVSRRPNTCHLHYSASHPNLAQLMPLASQSFSFPSFFFVAECQQQ